MFHPRKVTCSSGTVNFRSRANASHGPQLGHHTRSPLHITNVQISRVFDPRSSTLDPWFTHDPLTNSIGLPSPLHCILSILPTDRFMTSPAVMLPSKAPRSTVTRIKMRQVQKDSCKRLSVLRDANVDHDGFTPS